MIRVEVVNPGKNHAVVEVNGEEFCTIYGKNWAKSFRKLKEALQLHDLIITSDLGTIDKVIKELRKR